MRLQLNTAAGTIKIYLFNTMPSSVQVKRAKTSAEHSTSTIYSSRLFTDTELKE